MAKLLYIQQSEVYDDGSVKILAKFQPYVEGGTNPPPDDAPIIAIVTSPNGLNVRSDHKVVDNPSNVIGEFQNGEQIWVSPQTYATDGDDYIWRMVKKVNGSNDPRVGKYVAEKNRAGTVRFLDLDESKEVPPKASKYPVLKRTYGTRTFNSIQIDGGNSRQQTGANFTFGLFMREGDGAIIDPTLKANGVTNELTQKELDKFNLPHWQYPQNEEPFKSHIMRVRVVRKGFSFQQTVANGHAVMQWIKSRYTSQDGIPYIRILFCFTDTFGQYPDMYFKDEQTYHDQPHAKTGNRYWNDEVWRRNLLPFGQAFIEAMYPYNDYIFGYQFGNEFALNHPTKGGANSQSIQDYIGGVNELTTVWAKANGRECHFMTGQRTGHDIYQDIMSAESFYDALYQDSDLTCVNFHPYCNKPPIASLTPNNVFHEFPYMKADIENAYRLGLPIIADEGGTYQEGYATAQPQRNEVLKYALEYMQHEWGVWCFMLWNQMLRVDVDRGYGDAERGPSIVKKNAAGVSVAVTSTPDCIKVLSDHNDTNYNRG